MYMILKLGDVVVQRIALREVEPGKVAFGSCVLELWEVVNQAQLPIVLDAVDTLTITFEH